MISLELINRLAWITSAIVGGDLTHPARLAVMLEDLAADAWNEAKEQGQATWAEVEDLQPSIRIDP